MPAVLCVLGVIAVVNVILAVKLHSLRRGVKELGESLSEILGSDTNNLIMLSCRDRYAMELASQINDQLKILRKQRQYLPRPAHPSDSHRRLS